MALERLDKILTAQGLGSRKQVRSLIKDGLVAVNGIIINNAEYKSDIEVDHITVNGKEMDFCRYIYILLNKPAGVLTATMDKKAKTVLDLLPEEYKRPHLYPVGRLDKDTEGLLIITNNGEFGHQMLSPKKHVPKTYQARLAFPLQQEAVGLFQEGIRLDDGYVCLPSDLKILESDFVELVIYEGKFHQVKRMFQAVGNEVKALKRVGFGNLFLDASLKTGDCRRISASEIENIR